MPRRARLIVLCALVLTIACANVAGLLLARAAGRQRELAVRVALGASRARVIQLLMAESILLAVLGGTASVVLALWLRGYLQEVVFPVVGIIHLRVDPDTRFLVCTAMLAVFTAAGCGIVPALWATRSGVSGRLKQGDGHGMTARLRLRHACVVVQVAASVVLIVMAILFTRTLVRLTTWDTGMDLDHGVVAQIELQPSTEGRDGQVHAA